MAGRIGTAGPLEGGKPEIGCAGKIGGVGARRGARFGIGMAGILGPPEIRSSGIGIAATPGESSGGVMGGVAPPGFAVPARGPNENDCWQLGHRNSEPGAGSRNTSCIPAQ